MLCQLTSDYVIYYAPCQVYSFQSRIENLKRSPSAYESSRLTWVALIYEFDQLNTVSISEVFHTHTKTVMKAIFNNAVHRPYKTNHHSTGLMSVSPLHLSCL